MKTLLFAFLICFGLLDGAAITAANAAAVAQSQDVKFMGGQGVTLAGTLQLPKTKEGGRLPVVLILGDYGNTSRDSFTYGKTSHAIYRELADFLVGRGLAVLRFDKRCVGASECKQAETFEDYVDDARGALKFIRAHAQLDASKIFMLGHGEGGLIASSIAAHDETRFAGIVLAAMAGRTIGKVIRDQFVQQMTEEGKSQDEIGKYLEKYDRIIRGMVSGATSFPNEKFDPNSSYDGVLKSLIDNYTINISLLINDPLQVVNSIESPVLILQGRKDLMVAVKDAEYLHEAMKRAYHTDATLKLMDNVTHLLKNNPGEAKLSFNQDSSKKVDQELLTVLGDWIVSKAAAGKSAE